MGLTWGLGVEHEMLIGVDAPPNKQAAEPPPATQHYMNSKRVVDRAVYEHVRAAFEQVSQAVGHPLKSAIPAQKAAEEYEATRPPPLAIGRAPAAPAPVCRALLPGKDARQHAAKLAGALLRARVPHESLILVIQVLHPYVAEALWGSVSIPTLGFQRRGDLGEEAVQAEGKNMFRKVYKRVQRLVRGIASSRKFAAEVLAQLLAGAPGELAEMEAMVVEAGTWIAAEEAAVVHRGDVWRDNRAAVAATNSTSSSAAKRVRANGRDVFAAALRHSQTRILAELMVDKSGLPIEKDGNYVEAKTLKFRCVTAPRLLKELRQYEDRVQRIAQELDASARILPHSGYGATSEVVTADPSPTTPTIRSSSSSTSRPMYAGSHHFWFTLPHQEGATLNDPEAHVRFAQQHSAFAYALQWLQPLLLACTGGDPRAIGAGTKFPRANMRGTLNSLAGAGVVDVCANTRAMEVTFAKGQQFTFFDSDEELRRHAKDAKDDEGMQGPHVHSGASTASMAMLVPAGTRPPKEQPVLSCQSVQRMSWFTPDDGFDGEVPVPTTVRGFSRPRPASRWLPAQLMKDRYEAGFRTLTGNDFRFTWCDRFELPLKSGWRPVIVRRREKKDFVVRFYHAKSRAVSDVAPVATKPRDKRQLVGFEFRTMDNLPREALQPLMHIFVLAASASETVKQCGAPVRKDKDWSQMVASVLVEGRFAVAPRAYLVKLAAVLGLRPPVKQGMDARAALLWAAQALHEKYAQHPWTRLMLGANPGGSWQRCPQVPDTNLQAWIDSVNADPQLRKQVAAGASKLGPGWKYDLPYLREAGARILPPP